MTRRRLQVGLLTVNDAQKSIARFKRGPTRRARAYVKGAYYWRAEDFPAFRDPKGIIKKNAIFVVHGIGTQAYVETAVTLRNGIENAHRHRFDGTHLSHHFDLIETDDDGETPVPFTADGFWGDYDDVEVTFKKEWKSMSPGERLFFKSLWHRRAHSHLGTFFWFSLQILKLLVNRRMYPKWRPYSVFAYPPLALAYLAVALVSILFLALILIRHPKLVTDVLADVRVYIDPRGDVEEAMVQRIDRRVGEKFLQLLGLDWNFRKLPKSRRLQVAGKPHAFEQIVWIAHSLGTIVSYNVISDLLTRCARFREDIKASGGETTARNRDLAANVRRVEQGLHRFITMGSPLQKVAALYSKQKHRVLRPWPQTEGFSKPKEWWINIFHALDPISGALDHSALRYQEKGEPARPLVQNVHGRYWVLPWAGHTSYWHDKRALAHILDLARGVPDQPTAQARLATDGFGCRRFGAAVQVSSLLVVMACLLVASGKTMAWLFKLVFQ